jgi:xanthosine utilization system XapX-like protein
MVVCRYTGRALVGDYIRAAAGLAVGLGVLLSTPASPAIVAIFGGWSVLFGYFAYRTIQRNMTRVAITDTEICDVGFRTRVMAWQDLKWLKLRYFGTKRQTVTEGGFMQLKLRGGGRSLTYDSGLDGFDYVAWRAAKAIRENGHSLDPTSAGNLLGLGVDADRETPPPDAAWLQRD